MTLTITRLVGGPLETNAYIVVDDQTGDALVIDAPPDTADAVVAALRENERRLRQIVLTHGHWDHTANAARLHELTGAPLVGYPGLEAVLRDPPSSAPVPVAPAHLDRTIREGDTVQLGETRFDVLFLPGHDPNHIALYSAPDGVLLSGDVLFPGGHGTTEVPGSDQATMDATITRLRDLPSDVMVYPGHGETTTIGAEKGWMARK